MAEHKIELRKIRDFGENISDSFTFIKYNSAPLLKSFFAICAVFMLSQAVTSGVFQSRWFELFSSLFTERNMNFRRLWNLLGPVYLILVVLAIFTLLAMQVAVSAYMKFSVENNRKPDMEEVWNLFRRHFLIVCAYHLIIYLCLAAAVILLVVPVAFLSIYLLPLALILFIVPAVYLNVVLVPFTLVIMMEEKGFAASVSRCFTLAKENFWMSFAIYFIAYLIYMIGSGIVGLSTSIIAGIIAFFTISKMSTAVGIITSFLNIFSLAFYITYYTSVALNYFSLAEKKDGTGLLGRIDAIGNPVPFKETEQY